MAFLNLKTIQMVSNTNEAFIRFLRSWLTQFYTNIAYTVYAIKYAHVVLGFVVVIFSCGIHSLRWRHNGHDSVSNHQPHHCLPNRLLGCRSKKTSNLRVNGLCAGNSPGTGEFPAQMASNAENVSIWWRHRVVSCTSPVDSPHKTSDASRGAELGCFLWSAPEQTVWWFETPWRSLWRHCNECCFYWHLGNRTGNRTIAPVSVQQSWNMWVISTII